MHVKMHVEPYLYKNHSSDDDEDDRWFFDDATAREVVLERSVKEVVKTRVNVFVFSKDRPSYLFFSTFFLILL